MPPQDNPEQKREQALLSWIQQNALYGFFMLDVSLRVQSWNRWLEQHSSLPRKKVEGRFLFEVFPELETRKLGAVFRRALEGESSVLSTALHRYLLPFPSPLSHNPSDLMRQTARITPLLADGIVCGVIVVIEDVTQREIQATILEKQHRRDEALSWALLHLLKSDEPRKTVRQLFFKIAEHLDFDSFFLYLRDPDSHAVRLYTAGGIPDEAQKQFLEYHLFARVADEANPVLLNVVKNSPDPDYALLKDCKIAGALAIPLRINNKSLGALCFGTWNREVIDSEETELLVTIAQYLATALDKDNTQRQLRKIEEANQWMGAMVESTDDAIISKDFNGIIKSCNQGAARLFGYDISELVGQPITMLIPDDHLDEEREILQQIRSGNRLKHFETVRKRKDGSLVEVSLMISPVIDGAQQIIGASKIARDISERNRVEKELAESFQREKIARERAESANRSKDEFLASLSHELRTPLNPILLIASDESENPNLAPEVRAHFETIRKNIELEARLIDDLLDITRISHGKLSLHQRPVDIQDLLGETIRNVESEINEKQIELGFVFKASQKFIYGDDARLQQVFWNVLKNAIKFTPHRGKITITVSTHENQLYIAIADTGIGLAPAEMQRIFEAFSQGDHIKNDAHRFGGLGLGLAIARKLVEMHNGKISVVSEGMDKGSTFVIQIPTIESDKARALASPPPPDQLPAKLGLNVTVLLVEDHEVTRASLGLLLARRGCKVITASNIFEARAAAAIEKIDVVISDIGLPDGSGNELMKHLNSTFGLKGVAMTGYGMEADIEKSLKSGFVTHLVKPVNIRALENALKQALQN